jgi:hypothetical protein
MLAILLFSVLLANESPKVPVYVTSVGAQQGLTDPSQANRDSVKDIQQKVAKSHDLRLAETSETATVTLVVVGRKQAERLARLSGGDHYDYVLEVRLLTGDVNATLSAAVSGEGIADAGLGKLSSMGQWGRAAAQIVTQVEAWVRANVKQLASR